MSARWGERRVTRGKGQTRMGAGVDSVDRITCGGGGAGDAVGSWPGSDSVG